MVQQLVTKKNRREGKGRALALSRIIYRTSDTLFAVESETLDGVYYTVKYQPSETFISEWCTCNDYNSNRAARCKHIFAVQFALENRTVIKDRNKISNVAAAITAGSGPAQTSRYDDDGDEYTF